MKLTDLLENKARWERDLEKNAYVVYDADGKVYSEHKFKSQFDASKQYKAAENDAGFLRSGSKEEQVDERGVKWGVMKKFKGPDGLELFLGLRIDDKGKRGVVLFAKGNNKIWSTSIDGPMSTPEIRDEYKKLM